MYFYKKYIIQKLQIITTQNSAENEIRYIILLLLPLREETEGYIT